LVLAVCSFLSSLPGTAQTTSADTTKVDVPYRPGRYDAITDVPGIQVGHYTYSEGTLRGTTVILLGERGGLCAADVRGGNPVTVATHTLAPLTVDVECNAVVLTGGSVFGLAAVPGVVDFLYEHGRGIQTRAGRVPIVPAAVIFDLPVGDSKIHPRPEWGYKAAEAAASGPVAQGNVGAGAGGTMGKTPAGVRMKGGLGTASVELPGGVVVAALVVLNPLGDVVNPATGELYAVSGGFDRVPYRHSFSPPRPPRIGENTTLAVIATNARLDKTQLTKVAELAHNGLARSIRPIHSMLDGDTIFVVSPGWEKRVALEAVFPGEDVDRIGNAAADVLVRAILNGVQAAESIPEWPSYRDWLKARKQEAIPGQKEQDKPSDSPKER
jgi:L-aminopeptidase/D-esterase-like protein